MDLKERMFLTVEGQVTWADPGKGKNCSDCRHISKHPKPKPHKTGQCKLVLAHTGHGGKPFNAKKAIACSKYEG